MHNVEKLPNTLQNYWDVITAKFLKYVWSFLNIMYGRVWTVSFQQNPEISCFSNQIWLKMQIFCRENSLITVPYILPDFPSNEKDSKTDSCFYPCTAATVD